MFRIVTFQKMVCQKYAGVKHVGLIKYVAVNINHKKNGVGQLLIKHGTKVMHGKTDLLVSLACDNEGRAKTHNALTYV